MDAMMVASDQDAGPAGLLAPSRHFMAAAIKKCRWLPCAAVDLSNEDAAAEGLPAVLALWSSEAQGFMVAVGDIMRQPGSSEMLGFSDKLATPHTGGFTDLKTARLGDAVVAVVASSTGCASVLAMQLPNHPGTTSADLQMPEPGPSGGCLAALPWQHKGPVASVDVNVVTRSVLSVGQDGAIYIAPIDSAQQQQQQQQQLAPFRRGSGFSGFSQGRWVDSNTFVTAGMVGGLELWDVRRGGASAAAAAPRAWGHTGAATADAAAGATRQLLCLDAHPSRPNLCATGGSGGTVAVWDLRMAAAPAAAVGAGGGGDVWEVRFDPLEGLSGSAGGALPAVLFCTASGELARTAAGFGSGVGGKEASEVLLKEACSVNSFDVHPGPRGEVMAVTDFEGLLFAAR